MRIGIVGIGAMGCLFAARLTAVADVIMVGHWTEQIETLRSKGLIYIGPDGQRRQITVRITDRPMRVEPVPVALILVKSYQTESAVETTSNILQGNGIAVTLQNGLGNLETIAAALGPERAVPGATTEGATLLRPGVVRHAGTGATYLGSPQAVNQELVRDTATLFNRAGFQTEVSEAVESVLWRKLIVNAAINPLTAILDVPNGFLAEDGAARRLMNAAAQEVALVARAQGIIIGDDDPGTLALDVARRTAQNSSSMRQDISGGRPTEIEAISGSVVRLGQACDIDTPLTRMLLQLVRLRQQGTGRQGLLEILDQKDTTPKIALLRRLLQEVPDGSL
ncbi:MAG: ketopantoate reductase family protein [Chloroflexota bacterium]